MTVRAGDFWIANIPFTNATESKKRPVLVLWIDGSDVIVAVVTSAEPRTLTDVVLENWSQSGLRKASTVRLSRLDALEQSILISKIGSLSSSDAQKLKQIWDLYVKPQF